MRHRGVTMVVTRSVGTGAACGARRQRSDCSELPRSVPRSTRSRSAATGSLRSPVPPGEITRVARHATAADDWPMLVQRLVDAANAARGKDDVTVAFAAG